MVVEQTKYSMCNVRWCECVRAIVFLCVFAYMRVRARTCRQRCIFVAGGGQHQAKDRPLELKGVQPGGEGRGMGGQKGMEHGNRRAVGGMEDRVEDSTP